MIHRYRAGVTSAAAALITAFAVACVVLVVPQSAEARPSYFSQFKTKYSIAPGSNLDACGVCHFLWTGTGARNQFGTAVEQQLYLGKTITQSLTAVEGFDSDSDGFTNVDEITNFLTLPGYSCANFQDAIGAPTGYDTYITPMVASCLEPLDIRVDPPTQITVLVEVGDTLITPVEIFNNGTDDPINLSNVSLLPGTAPGYSLDNLPGFPAMLPVGTSIVVDLVFAPAAAQLADGFLRIESDDPDESVIDIDLGGFGFVKNLAPAEDRELCLGSLGKQLRKYSKAHLKNWGACFLDEVSGFACDAGRRDLKLAGAEAKFRDGVGGAKDKKCEQAGLTPSNLGMPSTCGGSCDSIGLASMADVADCLVCRQDEVMQSVLTAALGTAPPDLPPGDVSDAKAQVCAKKLLKAASKSVDKVQKTLGRCEVDNVTAASPVDCAADQAAALVKIHDKVDATVGKCKSTTNLAGCLFEPSPDPVCLGDAAEQAGTDLVDEALGFDD